MTLTIEERVYDAMLAAARRAAPLEACGLLGGRNEQATEFHALTNVDASGEHYSMLPEEQFAAVKNMRAKGARLLALWHSHPTTPARMSEEDLRLAYTPDVVYVILSLATPDKPDIRGFVINSGAPAHVGIAITDAYPPSPHPRSEAT